MVDDTRRICAFLKTCWVSNWSMKMALVSCVNTEFHLIVLKIILVTYNEVY
jgi:hypothetical protein